MVSFFCFNLKIRKKTGGPTTSLKFWREKNWFNLGMWPTPWFTFSCFKTATNFPHTPNRHQNEYSENGLKWHIQSISILLPWPKAHENNEHQQCSWMLSLSIYIWGLTHPLFNFSGDPQSHGYCMMILWYSGCPNERIDPECPVHVDSRTPCLIILVTDIVWYSIWEFACGAQLFAPRRGVCTWLSDGGQLENDGKWWSHAEKYGIWNQGSLTYVEPGGLIFASGKAKSTQQLCKIKSGTVK